jgi:hypothetical protein
MTTFYGQVKGNRETTVARKGSRKSGIMASVQSYAGSFSIEMRGDGSKNIVAIYAGEGSKLGGKKIFEGTMDEFCKALCGSDFEEVVE